MKSKKILSFLLVLCLMLSCIAPAGAITVGANTASAELTQQETQTSSTLPTLRNDPSLATPAKTGDSWTITPADSYDVAGAELPAHIRELREAASVYGQSEVVRAFVQLEDQPLISEYSNPTQVSESANAEVLGAQASLISAIERSVLGGSPAQIGAQLTFLTNGFTITTEFGNLEAIAALPGVKRVFLVPVYQTCEVDVVESSYLPYTVPSGEMSNVPEVWDMGETGYTGAGMTIAILDTGLDIDHPSFSVENFKGTDSAAFTAEELAELLPYLTASDIYDGLTIDDVYYSSKVPFGFNYSAAADSSNNPVDVSHDDGSDDHGTHVAGISAANAVEGVGVVGMAPDAQVFVMKVFGAVGGADGVSIVSALTDCLTLGVDVVNLSLGSAGGFSDSGDAWMDEVYASIATTEVVVNIAAGNDAYSSLDNLWQTHANTTSFPDNSTVASPSTYANVNSIASVDNNVITGDAIYVGGQPYMYRDGNLLPPMADLFGDGQALDYVMVPGIGTADDFATVDVKGKVAVVARGTISFIEKLANAEANEAIALIIYNNVDGSVENFGMSFAGNDGNLDPSISGETPAIAVSKNTGAVLAATAEAGNATFTVSPSPVFMPNEGAGQLSSFSSWGTTPDFRLVPDLSGVGGNVYSTLNGGLYGYMSGTSMACPQVAGISALIMQYLKSIDMQDSDILDALMMSTAVVSVSDISGVEASPRQQGAGLANALNAITSGAYITVAGETNDNKPKAELGSNGEGVYTFTMTIHNFSDVAKTYTTSGSLLTEAVDASYYSKYGEYFLAGYDCELSGSVEFSHETITVPAGETADVTVTITVDEDGKEFLEYYYPNGGYVEGFVYLTSTDEGGVDLSVPYMGFYGDWTQSPAFDTAYWYENEFWGVPNADGLPDGHAYYHIAWTEFGGDSWMLGINPYTGATLDENGNVYYDAANNVVSPNGDGEIDGLAALYLSLMRSAKELWIKMTDAKTDDVYYNDYCYNVSKSMYLGNYRQVVPFVSSWYYGSAGFPAFVNHVYDNEGNLIATEPLADGTTVNLTFTVVQDYEGEYKEQSMSFPVTIDISAPALESVTSIEQDGRVYLAITFTEAHPAYVQVANPAGTQIIGAAAKFVEGENGTYTTYVDVTGAGTKLSVALCDYAANESFYTAEFTVSDGDNIMDMDPDAVYAYRVFDYGIYADYVNGVSGVVYDSMYGWVSVNTETGAVEPITDDRYENYSLTAAEYVDGYIFAIDAGRNFVVIEPGTFNRTTVCNIGMTAYDMTWDATTNTMFVSGKMTGEYGEYYCLWTIDLLTGELTLVGYEQDSQSYIPYAMAATPSGEIYAIKYYDNYLYTVDKETGEMTYVTDAEGNNLKLTNAAGKTATPYYNQSMTYSEADNCIYWAYFTYTRDASELFKIIPATEDTAASISSVKPEVSVELVGMFTVKEDTDYAIPEATELNQVVLSDTELVLIEGKKAGLDVSFLPWNYAVTGDVTWTSSNTEVATVEDGVVTGVSRGTTTITATCEGVSATCDVTVLNASGSAYGFNYYTQTTSDSVSYDYWFEFDLATLSAEPYFNSPVTFIAADYNGHDGYIYGIDESTLFYRYNPSTDDFEKLGTTNVLFYDMAYDYSSGLLYGIDPYTGLYTIDPTSGKTSYLGSLLTEYEMGAYGYTLTCDTEGNLYTICAASGTMYVVADESNPMTEFFREYGFVLVEPVFEGLPEMNVIQCMYYDHNTGCIVWANADSTTFYLFDLELGAYTSLGSPAGIARFEYIGMFSVPDEIPELPEVAVEGISAEDLATFVGSSKKITTSFMPMNATNKTVVWTSTDESIATVDANGVVTGVAPGTVTLTGYSAENKEITVEITVTILVPADNLTTYVVSDLATMGGLCWGSIDVTNPSENTKPLADSPYFVLSAEYVDTTGKVYAYGYDSEDYSANHQFLTYDSEYKLISAVDMGIGFPFVYDMAYDYTTGTLYALASPNETNMNLYMVDMVSGKLILVQTLEFFAQSLVIDENGTLYVISDGSYFYDPMWGVEEYVYSAVYALDPTEGTAEWLFDLNTYGNMYASAAYDFDTGYIYWGRFASPDGQTYDSSLVVIDLENEACYDLGTINSAGAQVTGMMFQCENYPEAPTSLIGLTMSANKQILSIGDSIALDVMVRPFGYKANGVWTSSDETVATVNENGVVTAVGSGYSNVTYTVVEGGKTYTASCKIIIFSEDQFLISYNLTAGGFAMIDRFDPYNVVQFTEGEEVPVQTFEMVNGIIYGYDADGKYFTIDYANGFERTYLGEHGIQPIEDDYYECSVAIRDMAWDSANERMLVLICHLATDPDYPDYPEEIEGGCKIAVMDMETGALTELVGFNTSDMANGRIQALTVTTYGEVYFYSTFMDYFGVIDVETGEITLETTLQSMSIYGEPMVPTAMAYDEITDSIFLLLTTNGRAYRLISYDLATDMATDLEIIGEQWREGYYNYGNMFTGLVSVQDHLHIWASKVDNGDGTTTYTCKCGHTETVLTDGLHLDQDGIWRYYLNNKVATDFTGLVPHTNGYVYFVKNGVMDDSFTGLYTHTNGYVYYVHNGVVASNFTGLHQHTNGYVYYLHNGVVTSNFTGLYKHTNGYVYYIHNGIVASNVTGLYKHTNGNVYYLFNGIVTSDYTGLYKHTNGNVYYLFNGMVTSDYTGLYKHTNGNVYYLFNGMVASNYTGLYKHTNGNVYYLRDGIVISNYTGLYKHTNGSVYYLFNGIVASSHDGFYKHTDGKLYLIDDGIVAANYTGLAAHTNGLLYYVKNGVHDATFNGIATTVDGTEYEVVNGIAHP